MAWDPIRDLLTLQERLDRLKAGDAPGWTPAVDLYETPDRYVVAAELPGLRREEIHIELQEGRLVLRGRRPECTAPRLYQQAERGQGPFARTLVFADPIHADRVSAEFQDGVLTITVPKSARPGPRRIEVR